MVAITLGLIFLATLCTILQSRQQKLKIFWAIYQLAIAITFIFSLFFLYLLIITRQKLKFQSVLSSNGRLHPHIIGVKFGYSKPIARHVMTNLMKSSIIE